MPVTGVSMTREMAESRGYNYVDEVSGRTGAAAQGRIFWCRRRWRGPLAEKPVLRRARVSGAMKAISTLRALCVAVAFTVSLASAQAEVPESFGPDEPPFRVPSHPIAGDDYNFWKITFADDASDPNRFAETANMLFNLRHPAQRGLPIYDPVFEELEEFSMSGPSYEDQQAGGATGRENMRRFIKANIKFSMGTDAPTFLNYLQEDPNAEELADMVELGMTPMDTLIAGTRNGAEAIGMLDELGTIEIEKGKIADIIVVAGHPLESMEAMKRIAVVIKDGIQFK